MYTNKYLRLEQRIYRKYQPFYKIICTLGHSILYFSAILKQKQSRLNIKINCIGVL